MLCGIAHLGSADVAENHGVVSDQKLSYCCLYSIAELLGAKMRLVVHILHGLLLISVLCGLLVTADDDSDFEDDLPSEEFDDAASVHTHDHDDEVIESVKPLERVGILASEATVSRDKELVVEYVVFAKKLSIGFMNCCRKKKQHA